MDGKRRPGPENAALGVAVAAILAICAVVLWSGEFAAQRWMNHDVANALYIGRRIQHGDLLYVDWHYFVMPPIVFLSTGVCALADLLHLSPPSVIHLVVVATALLGIWVLRGAGVAEGLAASNLPVAIAILAYVGVLTHPGIFPSDFGQREHLFALLLLPHLLWRLSGAAASARVTALGVALGYAMMNKPHFIAAVATVELVFLFESPRAWRFWAALLIGAVLPFLALLVHSPASAEALFSRAFDYHLSGSYDTFSKPLSEFMGGNFNRILITGASISSGLLAIACWRRVLRPRNAFLLAILSVVTYLLFLQQQKFFRYHALPFLATVWVSALLLAWSIGGSLRREAAQRAVAWAVVGVASLLIAHGIFGLWNTVRKETRAQLVGSLPFLSEVDEAELVALFSPAVEGRLFTYAFARDFEIMRPWTSHYTLGSLLRIADPEEREEAIRAYYAPIARRIRDEAPDLVAFSPQTQSLPGVTLHRVIVDRYGLFPSAHYPLRKRFDNGWVVYRRRDGRSGAPISEPQKRRAPQVQGSAGERRISS